MVVGRRLHPAQAEAVERAERAAARVEQVQLQVEAAAARYRMGSVAAQELAPPAEPSTQKTASPTGGRQLRKARELLPPHSWTAGKERHRQEMVEAERGGKAWQAKLEQRLDAAHEEWRQLQQHVQQDSAHVGEAQASVRFWQTARNSGINLMGMPD